MTSVVCHSMSLWVVFHPYTDVWQTTHNFWTFGLCLQYPIITEQKHFFGDIFCEITTTKKKQRWNLQKSHILHLLSDWQRRVITSWRDSLLSFPLSLSSQGNLTPSIVVSFFCPCPCSCILSQRVFLGLSYVLSLSWIVSHTTVPRVLPTCFFPSLALSTVLPLGGQTWQRCMFHDTTRTSIPRQRYTRELTHKGRSQVGINVGPQYLNSESAVEGLPMKPVRRKSTTGVQVSSWLPGTQREVPRRYFEFGRFGVGNIVVYYESRKWELKIRLMNEGRWDERLKGRV